MSSRDLILAAIFAASLAAWFWQHEKWHELNTRAAALAAESKAYSEMCRALKSPNT